MSRKGRESLLIEALYGPVVRETDLRYTPRATVEALFDSDPPPNGPSACIMPGDLPGCVLDPCAGDGAILHVAKARGYQCAACEIREENRQALEAVCGGVSMVAIGDWRIECRKPWNVEAIVTNPPFSSAVEILEACFMAEPVYIAALLRCNTLGSNTWRAFWRDHPPTRIRLIERPSFPKPGQTDEQARADGTDMSDYFWAIWAGDPPLNLRPIP